MEHRSAEQDAARAASASAVVVRELRESDELAGAYDLFESVWGPAAEPVATHELLLVLGRTGSYVAGAYDGGRLVGASVGLLAADPAHAGPDVVPALHSHVTAVAADVRSRRVGYALKLHQRAWAVGRGLPAVTWTYDPLVRRNAHLNLTKLGAAAVRYVDDYYGALDDAINGGDATDRLVLRWDVAAPLGAAEEVVPDGTPVALAVGASSGPERRTVDAADAVLVAVPPDIESLRRDDPATARAWRAAVRAELGERMRAGWSVCGLVGRTHYLLQRGGTA